MSDRENAPHGRESLLPSRSPDRNKRRTLSPPPVNRQNSFQNIFLAALTLIVSLTISGCSGGPVIDAFAADYRVTEAYAGDSQLLLNILRAKDDIPIHFSDLSVIHGSLQMTAGATGTFPVAHLAGSTTPTTLTPSVGAQSFPTFDVGTLDTQEFTKGMLSPVDAKIIKQLFDQGVDPRLIMLLFFSDFRDLNGHVYLNSITCDPLTRGQRPWLGCWYQVYDYLDKIDSLFEAKGGELLFADKRLEGPPKRRQLQANLYVPLRKVGERLTGGWTLKDNLQDLRQLDADKHRLIHKQFYSALPTQLAICYEEQDHLLSPLFPISRDRKASYDACNKGEVKIGEEQKKLAGFTIRSAYEIIQFLGQILRFQQEEESNRCLTLSKYQRYCDAGEVLFQVNAPVGAPVIGARYAGGYYSVNFRECTRRFEQPCDHSLQVLAILELLLNANKSAKDIVAIPRVQVTP